MSVALNPSPTLPEAAHDADIAAGEAEQAHAFTDMQIASANDAVAFGQIELGTLAGFEPEEIEALYARALDDVRIGLVDVAVGRFLSLIALHPRDARFLRGLALCYQNMRNWGWAETVYRMALEHDPEDGIAMALLGEVTLYTDSKQEAHKLLSAVVARGVVRAAEAPFIERAEAILAKIAL